MLRNYIITAWRNLVRTKGFSAINIAGLAIGIAACLIIVLYVVDELGYDKYNEKADRIFRITSDVHLNGNGINGISVPAPMASALVKDFPKIEAAVRIRRQGAMVVKSGNESFKETNVAIADSNLFDVFTLPMVEGNPHTALVEPYSMVVTESTAEKYFNSTDVVGKTLFTDDSVAYKITGVIKDMPSQSHFHFDFIKAMAEHKFHTGQEWVNFFSATYILAKPGVNSNDINKMLAATVTKYSEPQFEAMHSSLAEMKTHGDYFRFYAVPLTSIHLHSHVIGEFEPNGNIQSVDIFMAIVLIILLLACINFMNLSTARSTSRSLEVGVRKVLGSMRYNLIFQFLVESVLTSFLSLVLAVFITSFVLPWFNKLSGKNIDIFLLGKGHTFIYLISIIIFVGLLAGSYPAFYLSSFKPVQVLKGRLAKGFKRSWLRSSLVVMQFTAATALIIGTIVIYKQLKYIRNADVGYNRNEILTINNTKYLGTGIQTFKQKVATLPGVIASTTTGFLPNLVSTSSKGYFKNAEAKASETVLLESWAVDNNYIPTLSIKVLEGRNFSPELSTDSSCVIINETAARMLGYKTPINQFIYEGPDQVTALRIIGVVKDFNAGSMHDIVKPIVFHLQDDPTAISFKISTANIPQTIAQIREQYKAVANGLPFSYSFMDDDFNKLYEADQRMGVIFLVFAVFAIFIACLGLFGLVTYAAQQRAKEVGIRKILGANVTGLVSLLSKDFLKLVLIAFVIASPIGWYVINKWLLSFAYRISISWTVFAFAGFVVVTITLLTVGYQSLKAAMANPVKSLRTE